jgi:hypothetical protein
VNQVTEVVIPFLVDRFLSAPKRKEKKEDPQEDKFRNQSSLPDFPVGVCMWRSCVRCVAGIRSAL